MRALLIEVSVVCASSTTARVKASSLLIHSLMSHCLLATSLVTHRHHRHHHHHLLLLRIHLLLRTESIVVIVVVTIAHIVALSPGKHTEWILALSVVGKLDDRHLAMDPLSLRPRQGGQMTHHLLCRLDGSEWKVADASRLAIRFVLKERHVIQDQLVR